ncbi:MAG: DNA mismatch repair protein MutS [Bacteroidaceae bacterium]|nr:DNA mismatch repair protein MutS [Bacteroidaceae bacterium]MBR3734013.1 DNA mismatch repair protein MutS [Bacteroidaceae bacterium]
MAEEQLTPMMAQFRDLKKKHPDAVMLFRCGDFYETYQEDAVTAAQVLGITLTHRNNKGAVASVEMAGFPYHALDTYLPRLIRAGYRVAICDQLEDPKLTKKLVKRGVTELVTPGVALTDNVLSQKENNFVAALQMTKGVCGVALLDITTGEFAVAEGTVDYIVKLLGSMAPKEVLIERGSKERFQRNFGTGYFCYELDDWNFAEKNCLDRLHRHFHVRNMKGYGVAHMTAALTAAGAILFYLDDTKHTHTRHITSITRIEEDRYVRLDSFTMRNLEVLQPMQGEGKSLLQVMDQTVTPMGSRMMRRWLAFPLTDVGQIERRLNGVEFFFREPETRDTVGENLRRIGDMERLVAKLASQRITPREMEQLRYDLEAVVPIKEVLSQASLPSLRELADRMDECASLRDMIAHTLRPDPPALVAKGGYIGSGVDAELDRLRTMASSGKSYLMDLQRRETERTGIQSLKVGYNNVFGYYLEVRNTYKELVPPEWIRKQTLTQAERYITEELKKYEEEITGAEEKILVIEARIYAKLLSDAQEFITKVQTDAVQLATADCLLSFALSAREHRYVRPTVDDSTVLDIRQGRHPVIETEMKAGESYIPNDVHLDTDKQQIIIITGPNMAGKSALLRQTALITLMAQVGSYVPADKARVGVVDKIFTRVGASDNISMGESTFMVEMTEAASIMNSFSERSLVLFDELGRGTSTYDGISIAWAIVEHLHDNQKGHPRTLFATHYHELNEMAKTLTRVHNYNVSVKEVGNQVVFLRKLVAGGSEHSFGIHVARMAGMPPTIVKRADQVLKELEASADREVSRPNVGDLSAKKEGAQLTFFQLDDPVLRQIRDRFLNLDINNLTPIEALNMLNEVQKLVKE